jgi:ubiquinol-cytochrome c reductase iron-sulfur subunit
VKPTRAVSLALWGSLLSSIGLLVLYVLGGQAQLEGLLLGLALGGLGIGFTLWGFYFLDEPDQIEHRKPLASPTEERVAAHTAAGAGHFTRRKLLARLAGSASGVLAAALALPSLSLGPRPGDDLFRTRWTRGARVVTASGEPLRPEDVPFQGVVTVFPEGHVGDPDSQAQLLRVEPDLLALPGGRERWTVAGCIAYSKLCTHAGCPVGLYRAEAHQLLCPCHQSTFDVLSGAEPVFGPAARPLPQLPLGPDDRGYLVALDDFSEPVGASFWNITRGEGP